LLGHLVAWESLSTEEHAMLCEQPAPHGPLFGWLEAQVHEHGAMHWGALREALRGHDGEALALKLMAQEDGPAPLDAQGNDHSPTELRQLLNRMLIERVSLWMNQAIEASKADPSALVRYRDLQQRKAELETAARELSKLS
jgi:DNA primase